MHRLLAGEAPFWMDETPTRAIVVPNIPNIPNMRKRIQVWLAQARV